MSYKPLISSLIFLVILTSTLACSKPADKAPAGKTPQQGVTSGNIPQGQAPMPSTSSSGSTSTIQPGGISGEHITFEADLNTFLQGVITDDRAMIESETAASMRDKIDTAIKELGFREFAKDGDYAALWEKVHAASSTAYTAVSSDSLVAVWMVNGKEAGLKDFQVQFDMVRDDRTWKVSKYTIIKP